MHSFYKYLQTFFCHKYVTSNSRGFTPSFKTNFLGLDCVNLIEYVNRIAIDNMWRTERKHYQDYTTLRLVWISSASASCSPKPDTFLAFSLSKSSSSTNWKLDAVCKLKNFILLWIAHDCKRREKVFFVDLRTACFSHLFLQTLKVE